MIKTEDLFTFEIDMGIGTERMTKGQLADVIYNCLDFCLLYGMRPHFYLAGEDAVHHPELWELLEILHEEDATFSILSEPEQSEYQRLRVDKKDRGPLSGKTVIHLNGDAYYAHTLLGNVLEDRLADMWVVSNGRYLE